MPTYTVKLVSIECYGVSDPGYNDEVWMMVQIDQGPPQRFPYTPKTYVEMNTGMDAANPYVFKADQFQSFVFTFENDVSLTLYDQDKAYNDNRTDFLGTCDFTKNDDGSPKTLTNGDSSNYVVNWEMQNWGGA